MGLTISRDLLTDKQKKATVRSETICGVIRAIERIIWIKTAEMVVELRIRPSVNFLTFP